MDKEAQIFRRRKREVKAEENVEKQEKNKAGRNERNNN